MAAFLTEDDYTALISEETLALYTEADAVRRQRAEASAQEEISSYLRGRYDLVLTWAAVGEARNAKLIELLIDLSIWNVLAGHTYAEVSEVRRLRRQDAIAFLQRVQDGRASLDLPLLTDGDGGTIAKGFRWGSDSLRARL